MTHRTRLWVAFAIMGFALAAQGRSPDVFLESRRSGFQGIPVVVLPFSGTASTEQRRLAETILRADLERSALFKVMPQPLAPPGTSPAQIASLSKAQGVISASLDPLSPSLVLDGFVHNAGQAEPVLQVKFSGEAVSLRRMVHRLSDRLVTHFTGEPGIAQTHIAYISTQTGGKEVYMMDYDGENEIPLTKDRSIVLSPRWSAQADQIAYTSYRTGKPDVHMVNIVTGERKILLALKGINFAPVWSPKGDKIAFSTTKDGNAEIYMMSPDGKGVKRLTSHDASDLSPSWSPSGRQIAFTSDRGGSPQIYVMDSEGAHVRRLSFSGTYNTSPAWSPKGDPIAYTCRNNEKKLKICLMPAEGGEAYLLTDDGPYDDESPSWAPDGKSIVFASTRLGERHLFAIHVDGTGLVRLTHGPGSYSGPAWSPR